MLTVIRKAAEEELPIIQKLNQDLFVYHEPIDPTLMPSWPFEKDGEAYFINKINGTEGICFVAEVAGEIVGYVCGATKVPSAPRTVKYIVELENIMVKEAYRGQNIGEKLSETLIAWGKERGAERALVLASAKNNGAIRFYERLGFEPYDVTLERLL